MVSNLKRLSRKAYPNGVSEPVILLDFFKKGLPLQMQMAIANPQKLEDVIGFSTAMKPHENKKGLVMRINLLVKLLLLIMQSPNLSEIKGT